MGRSSKVLWWGARVPSVPSPVWELGIPTTAAVIATSRFQAAVSKSERIRDLILRYKETLLGKGQQTSACHALHELEPRLPRWLLQALDRTVEHELALTQDFIAQMLGARRSTVTVIANKFRDAGLIRYHRGCIVVLDRARLEDVACECYRALRRRAEGVARPGEPAHALPKWPDAPQADPVADRPPG